MTNLGMKKLVDEGGGVGGLYKILNFESKKL